MNNINNNQQLKHFSGLSLLTLFYLAYYFHRDDGGDNFLLNIGSYKASRRQIAEDGILNIRTPQ
jgi:hypothetical protein